MKAAPVETIVHIVRYNSHADLIKSDRGQGGEIVSSFSIKGCNSWEDLVKVIHQKYVEDTKALPLLDPTPVNCWPDSRIFYCDAEGAPCLSSGYSFLFIHGNLSIVKLLGHQEEEERVEGLLWRRRKRKREEEGGGEGSKKKREEGGEDSQRSEAFDLCVGPMWADYVSNICHNLHRMEEDKRTVCESSVTMKERESLVTWLIEIIAPDIIIESQTLHLAVAYIDGYLSSKSIHRDRLELLGVTALFLASKYEEIRAKPLEEFLTDNTTRQQILDMEIDVFKTLKYKMGNPTVLSFLRKFCKRVCFFFTFAVFFLLNSNLKLEFLGYFLAELTLLDYKCLKFLPSVVAASIIFLAKFTIKPNEHPWAGSFLEIFTRYNSCDLKECVLRIQSLQQSAQISKSLKVVRKKYEQHQYYCVSALEPSKEIPAAYFEA